MYTFTQMNYPLQRRLYKIRLLTLAGLIAGLSGCNEEFSCPATGIVYTTKESCEYACRPPNSYTFPNFYRRPSPTESKYVGLIIFADGNGSGSVGLPYDGFVFTCSVSDCGQIKDGEVSCTGESECNSLSFIPKDGRTIKLFHEAGVSSSFAGWGGDEDCQDGEVTMDTDKYCIAAFNISKETKCN